MDLGHSVQFPFLLLCLHFQGIFSFRSIQCWAIAQHYPVLGSSKLPYYDFFAKGLTWGFWLPTADNLSPKQRTGLLSDTVWYDTEYITCHIREMGVCWVHLLLLKQPVHRQKCKLTIGCTTRTCAHTQLIASFPWTPAWRTAYSHLLSIHRDVRVGLWNYIRQPARDGPILLFTACCDTGNVHTVAAS